MKQTAAARLAAQRVASGLLLDKSGLYRPVLEYADHALGRELPEPQRRALTLAVRLNLQNRLQYPFHILQRRYTLTVSERTFSREKNLYVQAVHRGLQAALAPYSAPNPWHLQNGQPHR